MKITLIWIGKTNIAFVKEGLHEYLKRLKHYAKVEIVEIPDIKSRKALSKSQIISQEEKLILKALQPTDYLCLLDETGKQFSSTEFSKYVADLQNRSTKNLCLIIGGAYGVSEAIKKKSQLTLSLSKMTMTHQMIRLFLAEQLYRAYTIINNEKYHH